MRKSLGFLSMSGLGLGLAGLAFLLGKAGCKPVLTGMSLWNRWGLRSLVCGLGVCGAHAADPEKLLIHHWGPLTLRPQLGVAEVFSDNVLYQTSENAKGDMLTFLSPGLNLELGLKDRQVNVSLDYVYDRLFYFDRDDLNAANHGLAMVTAIDTDRLRIDGRDNWAMLSDVLGGATSLNRNVDRTTLGDSWRVEYRLSPKTGVFGTGSFNAVDYSSGTPLYDYNTWRVSGGFGYRPRAKVFFFGETYYGQSATTPNFPALKGPHLEFMGGFFGARGDFTPRLTGTVKAGYEIRSFSDDTPVPGAPVVDVTLDYRMSEKRTASLTYQRVTGVSVQSPSESYTTDAADLRLNQFLGVQRRLMATLGLGFNLYDYQTARAYAGRSDLMWRANAGLRYMVKRWLAGSLDYGFESFSSSYEGIIDYQVNRVTLRVLVGY